MSNTSSSPGSKGTVMTVVEWVTALFTFWWYLPARALWRRTYADWAGKGRLSLGFISGIWAGTQSGHALDGALGVLPATVPPSVNFLFGLIATTFYLFPIFYLTAYKALDSIWKPVEKGIERLSKEIVGPVLKGYVNTVKLLPLSSHAWDTVQDKQHRSGFLKLLLGILGFTALFGSLTLGWRLFNLGLAQAWTANWATLVLSQGLALLVALAVTRFVMYSFWTLLDEGGRELLAVGTSAATIYALAPYTESWLGAGSINTGIIWVAFAVQFLLLTAYLFPYLDLLLTAGFIRRVVKSMTDFAETVYREPRNPFRTAVLHMETTLVSLGVAALLFKLGTFLTLPFYGAAALSVLSFLGFYGNVGHTLDSRDGNEAGGLLMAIPSGLIVAYLYTGAGLPFSYWGGIAVGLLTLVVMMVPLWPLGYRLISLLVPDFVSELVGSPLAAVNKFAYDHWVAYRDAAKRFQKTAFEEDTNYHKLFLHTFNLLLTGGSLSQLHSPRLQHGDSRAFAIGRIIAGYSVIGQLLLSANLWGTKVKLSGTRLIGVAFGMLVGVKAGFWAQGVQTYSTWLSVAIGFDVANIAEDLIFPGLFATLRLLTDWEGPRDLALSLLAGLHSGVYNAFEFIWTPVKTIMNNFLTYILWPVLSLCVRILDGALALLKRIFHLS